MSGKRAKRTGRAKGVRSSGTVSMSPRYRENLKRELAKEEEEKKKKAKKSQCKYSSMSELYKNEK